MTNPELTLPDHDDVREAMHVIAQMLDTLFGDYPHNAIVIIAAPEQIDSDPYEDPMRVEALMKGPEELLVQILHRQMTDMIDGEIPDSTELFQTASDADGTEKPH